RRLCLGTTSAERHQLPAYEGLPSHAPSMRRLMPREYLARPDELRTVRTGNKLSVAIDHPSVNYQCRLIVPWLIQIRVIFASVVLYRPVFEGECMTYVSRPDASTSDGVACFIADPCQFPALRLAAMRSPKLSADHGVPHVVSTRHDDNNRQNPMSAVHIIDCHNANDYFADRADGPITQKMLKTVNIRAELHIALDRKHFREAVVQANKAKCDVLHIAGHGNGDGIASSSGRGSLLWADFVEMFQGSDPAPKILVMSMCCGASYALAAGTELSGCQSAQFHRYTRIADRMAAR
ncbi:hypothetical protein, partial [Mesorhizobium sp.]|uniref:hypothetical protein n=1 Tax=Mesorhizobium sp. TaxID=1871066 RepID=UPI0025C32BFC